MYIKIRVEPHQCKQVMLSFLKQQQFSIQGLRFFLAGAFLVAMNLSELHSQLEDGCSQQSVDLVSRWMVYYRRPVCSFENMFEHIILNAVRIIFNV